jgi:hypothetical protein
MRWLLRTLLLAGSALCPLIGTFILFIASALSDVAAVGRPTPQPLTLAELIARGPGDNAHVELTDFQFGKPIIEQRGQQWRWVWLPLEPAGKKAPGGRPVFLQLGDSPDQARLDQVFTQKTLTALVGSSLPPTSLWTGRPSETFRRKHPALDPDKALLLVSNPTVDLAGITFLSEDMIFEKSSAVTTQVIGWVLVGLGVVGAVLWLCGLNWQRVDQPRPPAAVNEDYLRERLLDEQALSIHTFCFWGALGRSILLVFGAVLTFVVSCVSLAVTAGPASSSHPILGIIFLGFTLGIFACVFLLLGLAIKVFTGGAMWIAVCPSGLRWRRLGSRGSALWSDIAKFTRTVVVRSGSKIDNVVLVLYSGESFHFWDHSLSDYSQFADDVGAEYQRGPQSYFTDPLNASLDRAFADYQHREWTGLDSR